VTLRPGAEPPGALPTPTQTLLLRAALLAGDPARDAWRQWREGGGHVRQALQGPDRRWTKRLLPLLWISVARHRLTADAELQTFLKLAYTAESVRNAFCRREGHAVLRRLTQEGLAPVVIRGFAFSETVYDEPCLRHSHDLDLFLPNGGAHQAQTVLTLLGFSAHSEALGTRLRCVHASGLQVTLHGSLFPPGVDARLEADALERCERRTIAEAPSLVLAPVDALVHACAHASSPDGFPSSMWICDLCLLLARRPDADWTAAAGSAGCARVARRLALTLECLATELDALIPAALRSSRLVSPWHS
jgi:hypothetical protein